MSRKKSGTDTRGRSAALLVALGAASLLTGGGIEDPGVLEARRLRIVEMGPAERNRLNWNYENYRKLSPERRQELTSLHKELEQDERAHGHLQKLLEDYNRWLSNLSPFDREKLLAVVEPAERAKAVKKLHDENKQQHAAAARADELSLAAFRPSRGLNERLSPRDLDAVVDALAAKFLTAAKCEHVAASGVGRERHVHILKLAMDQVRRETTPGAGAIVADEKLLSVLTDAIGDPKVKARVQALAAEPSEQRRELGLLVGHAVRAEWRSDIEAALPTKDELNQLTKQREKNVRPEQAKRLKSSEGQKMMGWQIAMAKLPVKGVGAVIQWSSRGFVELRGSRRQGGWRGMRPAMEKPQPATESPGSGTPGPGTPPAGAPGPGTPGPAATPPRSSI